MKLNNLFGKEEVKMSKRLRVFIVCVTLLLSVGVLEKQVFASSKYITTEEFVTRVVKELKLKVDKTESNPYIEAAIKAGLIGEDEFNLVKDITRTDAAVILVRADEYKYGVTIDDELVDLIIEKRISDINKVSKSKREYVAKIYALGYIKGYSNGSYSTDREFRGGTKLTANGANDIISMLSKPSKRAKISPDGQLLRTTNLPSNADMYPYILASYPNAYYDWEFKFMKWTSDGVPIYGTDKLVNLEQYASPKDTKSLNLYRWDITDTTIEEVYNSVINIWVEKVKKYVETVFNVDYRTLKKDTEWFNTVIKLDYQFGWKNQKNTEDRLKQYIDAAIKNKTIVESSLVAIDGSTLYHDRGLHLRVYVKYCIHSALDTSQVRLSPIVFTNENYPHYDNVKLGEWRNGYFDVSLNMNGNGDFSPEFFGIKELILVDSLYKNKVVK